MDFAERRFDEIRAEFAASAAKLEIHDVQAVPVSALLGANITERSANTPWYDGPALLDVVLELMATGQSPLATRFDLALPTEDDSRALP